MLVSFNGLHYPYASSLTESHDTVEQWAPDINTLYSPRANSYRAHVFIAAEYSCALFKSKCYVPLT